MHLHLSSFLFLGNFTCHVENDIGKNKYTYEIIVYDPPKIVDVSGLNQTILEVISNGDLHAECQAYGIPPPDVIYTFYIHVVKLKCDN